MSDSATRSGPAIRVRDLIYEYPGHRALHGVGFDIEYGSVTALAGPNGAGKTTLMSCIAALSTPFSGQIQVHGVDVLEHPREGHRHIGYLKDFFGLYDALSVQRTLWHAARSQGIPPGKCEEAVARVTRQLDLGDLLARPAGTLSRGQRQRLAIARALVHRPPVLLLDEPASGLDPEARDRLAQLMRRLRDEGMTLMVSSHILAELAEYSTDMMIIRDGRVLEQRAIDGREGAWLRLELALPVAHIPAAVLAFSGVQQGELDAHAIRLRFEGDAGQRAALLRLCLDQGLAICGFSPEDQGLQDEYLRTVRGEAGILP
jgi:ABC-2 type transport system ATP-binding protein